MSTPPFKAPFVCKEHKSDSEEKKAYEILEKRISLIEDQLRTLIAESDEEWAPEDDEEEMTDEIDWSEKP